jgi:N-acyl-D-amino-acid deacylase
MTAATVILASVSLAQPVTGKDVPELDQLDQIMLNNISANNLQGGVLGVMRNGVIVYQRGFGWSNSARTVALRQDAPMRVASVTKPITAAAIQRLYADGTLDPNDIVFDVGQQGGGILNLAPFPSLINNQYGQITVQHVLSHTAGLPWNQNWPDPMFQEITIADDFNDGGIPTSYPPGRQKTVRWMMGNRNLITNPGGQYFYSNEGFMVLGLVIEQVTGQSWINHVRGSVFGPMPWQPLTDIVYGRTFAGNRDPREPFYSTGTNRTYVFDDSGDVVNVLNGGYDHEQHVSSGGVVITTAALLNLAEMYYVNGENVNAGQSATYGQLTGGIRANRNHNGLLWGTEAWVEQRTDGINYAIILNSGETGNANWWIGTIRTQLDALFDGGTLTWPDTDGYEGQWANLDAAPAGNGSYETPWNSFATVLASSPSEATVNIKPSTQNWTGTITQRIRLRAPEGLARIGQ